MFKPAVKTAQIGLRNYSSQAAKAQSTFNTVAEKATGLAKCGVYYTKVAGELAKYIWLKEGLSPPTVAEVQKTFTTDLKALFTSALKNPKQINQLVEQSKNYTKDDYIRFGAYGVQFLGLFALGEIIGRRHIYGYKDHKHDH